MTAIVQDADLAEGLIEERRRKGLDGRDEVWEGVYIIMPNPDDEHQDLIGGILSAVHMTIQLEGLGKVRPGVNISDRIVDWKHNFRVPDIVVFLNDTLAECHDTFWFGGPDFAIEIVSPDDRTRDKLGFYAQVQLRELLIVDRDPWSLELYRRQRGKMKLIGRVTRSSARALESDVLPLSWRLIPGDPRPQIEITHKDGRRWLV
jgi:Uma2 family endonuclease